MKKLIIILSSLALLGLAGCASTPEESSVSSSTPSSETPFPEPSSSEETITLPTTLDEIKANIIGTKFKGYSFEETGKRIAKGNVAFQENELKVEGSSTYDGDTSELFVFRGFDDDNYYSIQKDGGKSAKKLYLVETIEDESKQITKDAALEKISEYRYNSSWFTSAILELFQEGNTTKFESKEKGEGYVVTLSEVSTGRVTKDATLNFDKNNQLLSGEYNNSKWGEENWDETKNEPIDKEQNPSSFEDYKATLVLGEEAKGTSLSIDASSYFVSSIDTVYVSSYSDKQTNNGKAVAGDYVDLELVSYSPSTAFNNGDIKIISSSNPEIIEISSYGSAKALKAGTCTLTVGDPLGEVTKEIQMTVTNPSIHTIYLYAGENGYSDGYNATIAPNEEKKLKIDFFPKESDDVLEASSTDNSIVQIVGISEDRTILTVKGLKEGTALISVHVKGNTKVANSRDVAITVEAPVIEEDSTWLIGTWKGNTSASGETFTNKFEFKMDKTGSVTQKVAGVAVPNEASFSWSYTTADGLKFSKWSSEDYMIQSPSKIVVSDDKATLTITARCTNSDDDYQTISMVLKKEATIDPAEALLGTWTEKIVDVSAKLILKSDKTASLVLTLEGDLTDEATFSWTYDGTTLKVVGEIETIEDGPITEITFKDVTSTNMKATIRYMDYDGDMVNGNFNLAK